MITKEEALKLALEALEYGDKASFAMNLEGVKANLRTAIEQAEKQEPLVTKTEKGIVLHTGWDDLPAGTPLYTTPPAAQRQWVGLTNQELVDLTSIYSGAPLYCAIEAKLREKNT